ncbi:sulfurtransferase [Vibrio sp. V27_P1S3P104]|uniref:rhodanese-like domain-containing protein n=1 Tax=Vibrio TaxID=662 RepID=UPI000C16A5BF|nr:MULTISPECIES: rhodanese-like domain-containing protein [Vibrio]NAW69515.1 sulfurtransferase [Vibrio sp. V28_P6S34P95]NAX04479.1 sulfurtransferase [Vibrio sp. V30_P3S12P165]NAX33162.1 sulfurtransferase [Vibrio sp. V29_P1S30P107]NAX38180.1 sulfurtransferase [Vibrio sp. V27_P1S3P104]NAX40912.1 sulfurtransferase [Vibrio sp. V26_P1S5P106]
MRLRQAFLFFCGCSLSYMASSATFSDVLESQLYDVQIVDCRDSNFYNGWPERGQTAGGHIPGAVNFDAHWVDMMSADELKQLIDNKSLIKEHHTFLYCAVDRATQLKTALVKQGFQSVEVIDQPLAQYQGELVALPRYQNLVPAWWVNDVIQGKKVQHAPSKNYTLLEVAWGPATKYLWAHIPGAQYVNTNDIESKPWWNRVSNQQLEVLVNSLGIEYDSTVILYGRENMAAARLANILMYAGVQDVRLLNGGWQSWEAGGYKTAMMSPDVSMSRSFGKTIPANPNYILDLPEAKALLTLPQDQQSLVSIRTLAEFNGETSGYDYIQSKGHIPGAKWGHAGSDAFHLEDFRNPDQTMRSADEITQFWHESNIEPQQQVSFFCGTGWRASEVFFDAYVMGWENISVYDGGWYQWAGK